MNAALEQEEVLHEPQRLQAQVLYIGKQSVEIGGYLVELAGSISAHYVREVGEAMGLARSFSFDVVIVDQRDKSLVRKLIIPLIVAQGRKVKLVVLCDTSDLTEYLNTYGVTRVLTAPVRAKQILKIVGDAYPMPQAVKQTTPVRTVQEVISVFDRIPAKRPIARRVPVKKLRSTWRDATIVLISFLIMATALVFGVGSFAPQYMPPELWQLLEKPLAQLATLWPVLQWQIQQVAVELINLTIDSG